MSHADDANTEIKPATVAALLRALATRAARDPQLAAAIAHALGQHGLLETSEDKPQTQTAAKGSKPKRGSRSKTSSAPQQTPDPFAVWRAQGEDGLRALLAEASLEELRATVRAHRLDPARVSSRWTAHDRVAALIFDQVRARMRHGRAFERV